MKKIILASALVLGIGIGVPTTTGCNSAWWQNFQNDPVAGVHTFEQGVVIALNGAQLAWATILPLLPASVADRSRKRVCGSHNSWRST